MQAETPKRQMTTEEYLRTEVFGEARRKEQKRCDNVARFVDRPMTMEEYVKYAVYGEDLPDHLIADEFRKTVPAAINDTRTTQQRASGVQISPRTGASFGNDFGAFDGRNNRPIASSGFASGIGQGYGAAPLQLVLQYDAQGRIARKIEAAGSARLEHTYVYDAKGRLAQAWRSGMVTEQYAYNALGQRVQDVTAWRNARELAYDKAGRLVQAGDTTYEYSPEGALQRRIQRAGSGQNALITLFAYGADTLLDAVTLPDGTQITYQYGATRSSLGPKEKYVNGVLAESYLWQSATRLSAWIDHVRGIRCMFHYGSTRSPVAVTVEHEGGTATFRLGFDQVGTLKLVASPDGKLIKEMVYDSFGNMYADSNPELFLPLGFASGLVDRHTGLIRFGCRDYDPEIGRFTALDPAKDMRGDGDLWDYCVDDPINCVDPWGLETQGIGIGGSLSGFGFGAGMGLMLVKDDKGNWGIEGYGDYGASSGFGVSAEGAYQTTTAHTIKDLAGISQKAGSTIAASPALPIWGKPSVVVGAEKVKGSGYDGDTKSIGLSWGGRFKAPVDVYVKEENSVVVPIVESKK